jgi:Fe-Mn family superoxide dismutase
MVVLGGREVSYQLQELPYSYDALEPFIDAATMELHHGKHHAAYVENLNKALEEYPELQNQPLDSLLSRLELLPDSIRAAVRDHGGGHYNHALFWNIMKRDARRSPDGELGDHIQATFGSFLNFKAKFSQMALGLFGSGWSWLCWRDGKLEISSTANQENPIMRGAGEPVLGLDVWEHAYYLRYQHRRADYIEAWWNVVNWEQVSENYVISKKMGRPLGFSLVDHPVGAGGTSRFPGL